MSSLVPNPYSIDGSPQYTPFVRTDRRASTDPKIIGGEDAPAEYPYQISLQVRSAPFYLAFIFPIPRREWMHNCGGSIVTARHVVTAAHCLKNQPTDGLSVWAGTTKLNGADGTRLLVASYIIHPDYVELNRSDIGIIRTSEPFVFGERVSTKLVGGDLEILLNRLLYRSNRSDTRARRWAAASHAC